MAVLDPLEEKTSELVELSDNLLKNHIGLKQVLSNRRESILFSDLEVDNAYINLFYDDLSRFQEPEDIDEELEKIDESIEGIMKARKAAEVARKYAKRNNVEPDFQNPIESWHELGKLKEDIHNLPENLLERFGFEKGYTWDDLKESRKFYSRADTFDAYAVIEGVAESEKIIEEKRDELLENAVNEYERIESDHDAPEIPDEPVNWAEVINDMEKPPWKYAEEENLGDRAYGFVIDKMMEEKAEEVEGVNVQQAIHFVDHKKPCEQTLRPDAVDELFVYDFKHMPHSQYNELSNNGGFEHDEEFIENVHQMNTYLNEMGLPVGILVYISSGMNTQEIVVERHEDSYLDYYKKEFALRGYGDKFVHKRENYEFDNIVDRTRID